MKYYDLYKPVRNRLRKYSAESVCLLALMRLQQFRTGDPELLRTQPPWLHFLLLKWAIVDGDWLGPKPPVTDAAYNDLLNRVHDFPTGLTAPTQGNLPLFVRRIAYQQFWHQANPPLAGFCRQVLLFGSLKPEHPYSVWMQNEYGLSIDAWLTLSMYVLSVFRVRQSATSLDTGAFSGLDVPEEQVQAFLASMSASIADARAYLKATQPSKKHESEYREVTPLLRFPLLRFGSRYHRTTLPVLTTSIQHFLYDRLRGADANWFMTLFGGRFEKYVASCLLASGAPFKTEAQIKVEAGSGKTVDFLIESGRRRIFLEAKGVELAHGAMTSYNAEYITSASDSSIVKGLKQGLAVAARLRSLRPSEYQPQNCYLMVVTYKDLILSGGLMLRSLVGDKYLSDLVGEPVTNWAIAPSNIYFVGIEDFELACGAIESGETTFGQLLARAVSNDAHPGSRKLLLHQHVSELVATPRVPTFLEQAWADKFQDLEAIHPDGES